MTLPAHKNSNDKPRPIPKMSARKLARFRSENAGAYPRSSITPSGKTGSKFYPAVKLLRAGNKTDAKIRKPIPSRKKRTGSPILSTPWLNALDSRSYVLRGRVKLYGADKKAMRERIFARAGGYCEEIIRCPLPECNEGGKAWHTYRCPNPPTEWSHNQHGAKKSDAFDAGIASCGPCHRRRHGQY